MKAKKQKFDIVVDGKFIKSMRLVPCAICGGHPPVTKKAAEQECVGHMNLRDHISHAA